MSNKRISVTTLLAAVLSLIACFSFAKTDHRDYKEAKPRECRDCHKESGVAENHGASFLKEHRLLAQKAGSNCADCHNVSYCQDCHKGGNIDADLKMMPSSRGEQMPKTHAADYISTHPIVAKNDQASCYRCHEEKFCSDCHTSIPNRGQMQVKNHVQVGNTLRYNFTSAAEHAADARQRLQSCEGCHPDAVVCTQCHNLSGGTAAIFRSTRPH